MLFHWTIKLFNIFFVLALGAVTFSLLWRSVAYNRVRRSSSSKRAEFFLKVTREGDSFLLLPLRKSHYLIGRGPECDIRLRGKGIPLRAGIIHRQGASYRFSNFLVDGVTINGETVRKGHRDILPGDTVDLYKYSIAIEA